jgi:hypothetical protein
MIGDRVRRETSILTPVFDPWPIVRSAVARGQLVLHDLAVPIESAQRGVPDQHRQECLIDDEPAYPSSFSKAHTLGERGQTPERRSSARVHDPARQ